MEQEDGVAEECWVCHEVFEIFDLYGQILQDGKLRDGVFCDKCWAAAGTKAFMEKQLA